MLFTQQVKYTRVSQYLLFSWETEMSNLNNIENVGVQTNTFFVSHLSFGYFNQSVNNAYCKLRHQFPLSIFFNFVSSTLAGLRGRGINRQ